MNINFMYKIYFFFISCCLLAACSTSVDKEKMLIPKNTLPYKATLINIPPPVTKKDTASDISTAHYHPMYIGKAIDTLIFPEHYNKNVIDAIYYPWDDDIQYPKPNVGDLSIWVDTSLIIRNIANYYVFIPPPPPPPGFSGEIEQSSSTWGNKQAYSVFIKNKSNDTLDLGYGNFIPLTLEAKDSKGVWKTLQKPYIYGCGTGLPHLRISPQEMAFTVCNLYEGNFYTKMRLHYGFYSKKPIYSNEFWGTINPLQFADDNDTLY